MAKKYYAVKKGRETGIYETWNECKAMVNGYPAAVYKSFSTKEEAEAFMTDDDATSSKTEWNVENKNEPYAFVDGSFNPSTKVYGYGGFLFADGKKYVLQGSGTEPELVEMNNVSGELAGSMAAITKAIELGLERLDIYYDYMGIEMWANGTWKRNKAGTKAYYDFIQSIKEKIDIHFIKVAGHSGIDGNEEADKLARKAAGVE